MSVFRTVFGQSGPIGLLARRAVEVATPLEAARSSCLQGLVARRVMDLTKRRVYAQQHPALLTATGKLGVTGRTARSRAAPVESAARRGSRSKPPSEGSNVMVKARSPRNVQSMLAHRTASGQRGQVGQCAPSLVAVASASAPVNEASSNPLVVCLALVSPLKTSSVAQLPALETASGAPGVDGPHAPRPAVVVLLSASEKFPSRPNMMATSALAVTLKKQSAMQDRVLKTVSGENGQSGVIARSAAMGVSAPSLALSFRRPRTTAQSAWATQQTRRSATWTPVPSTAASLNGSLGATALCPVATANVHAQGRRTWSGTAGGSALGLSLRQRPAATMMWKAALH
mmetsp:Transcript_33732/g.61089  ORF Transcript_33732/g.61089 Transcript_33732/m.61089 type:complete len:344 (-) Transcript_33732:997-2028(-)